MKVHLIAKSGAASRQLRAWLGERGHAVVRHAGAAQACRALDAEPTPLVIVEYVSLSPGVPDLVRDLREACADRCRPYIHVVNVPAEGKAPWELIAAGVDDLQWAPLDRSRIDARLALLELRVQSDFGLARAAREAEDLYRSVFEASPVGILTAGPTGMVTSMNDAYARIIDRPDAGPRLSCCLSLLKNEAFARAGVQSDFAELLQGRPLDVEAELADPDGAAQIVRYRGVPMLDDRQQVRGCVVLAEDVTERLRTERELQQSNETLRALIEASPLGISAVDLDGNLTLWNPACERMFGWQSAEVLGRPPPFVPDDRQTEQRRVRAALRRGQSVPALETVRRRKDGSLLDVLGSFSPLFDAARRHRGFMAQWANVGAQKRAEQALRESGQWFRAIFDHAAIGIAQIDLEGRPVITNHALQRILGYSDSELQSMVFAAITHPEDVKLVRRLLRELIVGKRESDQVELRLTRKDGEVVSASLTVSLVRDAESRSQFAIAMVEDVTQRKHAEDERHKLEAQMRQAQKLESLGVLAGGIAHDFNNLLMGVLGNAGLALQELPAGSSVRESLQDIETAAQRAAELTNQMLAYAGKGRFVVQALHLSGLAREMAHLLGTVISKKASLRYELATDLQCVRADATQLRQVVMNLITNASDALSAAGGSISVRTGTARVNRAHLVPTGPETPVPEGVCVFLEVSDTGSGMDDETRRRIFEPFFTTKFAGRGLGLAAVLGIVRSHGGALELESAPGRGARFRVLLPAVAGRCDSTTSGGAPRTQANWRTSGTVLLVDDEASVRSVSARMLERLGLTVLTAEDGMQGVAMFRRHAGEIVLVLMDLTMPNLDGDEAFRRIRAIDPQARVVLMSGYSEEDTAERIAEGGLVGFLQKPFQVRQLQQLLARAQPAPPARS